MASLSLANRQTDTATEEDLLLINRDTVLTIIAAVSYTITSFQTLSAAVKCLEP